VIYGDNTGGSSASPPDNKYSTLYVILRALCIAAGQPVGRLYAPASREIIETRYGRRA